VFSKADRFANMHKGTNPVGSYDIKSQFSQVRLNTNKGFGSESKRFSFLGVGKGPMPNQSPYGENFYTTNVIGTLGRNKSSDMRDLKN
jgi:hypothetical protein